MHFSILIPTWNNLAYLKLCIRSIEQNSRDKHQILIHINDGSDGTLEWVQQQGLEYVHSQQNVGVCWALNGLRPLVTSDYIVFANDDMYMLPDWDFYLSQEIESIGHKMFFLSSTLIQPRPFFCKSVMAPYDYGQSVSSFREADLLADYAALPHEDWCGGTWPVNVVHKDVWDLVGGYSVEFSPGMYSDPDFSAKLWMAGVRCFKGISKSRVYHFEARSTGRVTKNKGERQFLAKWGITSRSFMNNILHRGERFDPSHINYVDSVALGKDVTRSKFKRMLQGFQKMGNAHQLWQ